MAYITEVTDKVEKEDCKTNSTKKEQEEPVSSNEKTEQSDSDDGATVALKVGGITLGESRLEKKRKPSQSKGTELLAEEGTNEQLITDEQTQNMKPAFVVPDNYQDEFSDEEEEDEEYERSRRLKQMFFAIVFLISAVGSIIKLGMSDNNPLSRGHTPNPTNTANGKTNTENMEKEQKKEEAKKRKKAKKDKAWKELQNLSKFSTVTKKGGILPQTKAEKEKAEKAAKKKAEKLAKKKKAEKEAREWRESIEKDNVETVERRGGNGDSEEEDSASDAKRASRNTESGDNSKSIDEEIEDVLVEDVMEHEEL